MSGGPVCKCRPRDLWVIQRNCHHSAFAGYHRTPSDYSSVVCRTCGAYWRTKADYVGGFPNAPADWGNRIYEEIRRRADSGRNRQEQS